MRQSLTFTSVKALDSKNSTRQNQPGKSIPDVSQTRSSITAREPHLIVGFLTSVPININLLYKNTAAILPPIAFWVSLIIIITAKYYKPEICGHKKTMS
jgi:hypothetical protein